MTRSVDPQPEPPALKAVRGNVTYSLTGATAWFMVPRVRHSFRSDQERDQRGVDVGLRLASLTGRWVFQRSTSRPWSVEGWRDRMAADAIRPLDGYSAHLDATAKHLRGRAHAMKLTYLGVSLNRPMPGVTQALDAVRLHGAAEKVAQREDGLLASQVADVTRAVSGDGLNARPALPTEMQWLLRRSVALGCPVPEQLPAPPGDWDDTDIEQLADTATLTVMPFGRTVKVVAEVNGREVVRYVCVSSFGRTDELETTSAWLAKTDQLGFAVETSVRAKILPAEVTVKQVRGWLDRIKYQKKHHEDHEEEPPQNLAQAHDYGMKIQEEIRPGATGLATRANVWVRMAVSGRTEDEAIDRATQLHDLYLPDVDVVRKRRGQYRLVRGFLAEEPLASTSFKRTMSVRILGSGMLSSSSAVGHEIGVHLGHTASGANRLPVFWHPWRSMEEREGKGVTTIFGSPGGGKSFFAGKLIYNCVLGGVRTYVLDPARQLAALCDLPEFAGHAVHIDLLSARPGICSPYRVIPEPIRDRYDSRDEFEHAVSMVHATRQQNAIDVLTALLPAATADRTETEGALSDACGAIPGYPQNSLLQVLGELKSMGGHAETIGRMLERVSKLPAAQLVFPSGYNLDADDSLDDALLTVISMKGLQLPNQDASRRDWTTVERMSTALLSQAAWLTQRAVHTLNKADRKLVIVDEAHHLERDSAGRLFLNTAARQARPHNERLIVISQGAADHAATFDGADLIDSTLGFRTEDIRASDSKETSPQRIGLRSLGIPVGVGFEKVLGTLSSQNRGSTGRLGFKEALWSDGEDGCERIVITKDDLPKHVQEALDTTPRPAGNINKMPSTSMAEAS